MTFSRPGAIDLSALKKPPASQSQAAQSGQQYVVDVTEESFQEVVNSSARWLVILALWSSRAPQSREFTDLLVAAASRHGGSIQIARVDVDANPQIAQALQAQAVPMTVALVQGRPAPLFQGTVSAEDVDQTFDELARVAVQSGLTGRAPATSGESGGFGEEPAEEVEDPRFAAVDAAYVAGDFATAVSELERLQAQQPADTEIAERLAGTKLMARIAGADLQAARQAAADGPADVDAQLLVADLDISGGHVDDAFDRLLALIAVADADQRDLIRERLLELFTVVGVADPRVATARRRLATALY